MAEYSEPKAPVRNLVHVLRAELAWYPGRAALVARVVLACTSVMLLAEVFRIPGAILGASFPILISRENLNATRRTAFQIGLACTIATADAIFGGMLTAGSPFLHVMWVVASLFAAFCAISSLNFMNAALTASAVLAIAIRTWDYPIPAELRVESTLYTWLAILLACAVSVIIEALFAKKNPPDPVLDGISRRLNLMQTLLSQVSAPEFPSPALSIQMTRSAARGVDDLCEILATSRYPAGFHDLLATAVALTNQLIVLGSAFVESSPSLSVEDQERCRTIAQNLSSVRSSLARLECPAWVDLPFASRVSNPILMEVERTTNLIAQCFCNESFRVHCCSIAVVQAKPAGASVAGALRNPEHTKFAVRGTLSAFLCYLFYMSTGWTGLATSSILTCTLTARQLTGAGRQRQSLRFAGFVVGAGVIGWGTEVFILPQLNTIAEYAVLFASVVWVGSWIATSGPRIAFSGFQIVLAYSLVNLNRFTINTSLVPARDAVLGVLLGVVAMWLVFDHLWAKTSNASVRTLLLGTLRSVANFKTAAALSSQEAYESLTAGSAKINRDFDKLRDLADLYAFESFPKGPRESLVNRSILTLVPELRAFLLMKIGLLQQRSLVAAGAGGMDEAIIQEVEDRAASVLHGLADAIEAESPDQLSPWNALAEDLRSKVSLEEERSRDGRNTTHSVQLQLCASLLNLVSDLERRARLNFVLETGVAREMDNPSVRVIAEI
jgi:multidrug resistance protein MdtO